MDMESLAFVANEYGSRGITTLNDSILSFYKNKQQIGSFDFICALGLYDYLNNKMAKRLNANLFARLNPGGELVVANFQSGILDMGYMESYMAWELIYRDYFDTCNLYSEIPAEDIMSHSVFSEPEKNPWCSDSVSCNPVFLIVGKTYSRLRL